MLDLIDPLTLTSWLFAADTPRPIPEPEEVKAGYIGLLFWIGLIVAIGLLGWSLVRQLKRTQVAKQKGVYGEDRRITDGPAFQVDEDDERS